jgi:hypothetical protein
VDLRTQGQTLLHLEPLRKWMGFSFRPIRWQGYAVLVGMATFSVPFAFLWLKLVDERPVAGWLCAGISALAMIIGYVVILWKLERTYGR